MPKKKVGKPAKKPSAKKTSSKAPLPKKVAAAKNNAVKSSKLASKKVTQSAAPKAVKKTEAKPTPAKAPHVSNPEVSLGRPLVTQEEKLYMLFHDDYQARQVFEFLRVDTVKELEQFSQQQIVHMMSKPLRTTIDRIRQRLAQFKRSLKDDEQFAADFLKKAD